MRAALAGGADNIDAGLITLAEGGECTPEWVPTFGGPPGVHGRILVMTVFDDGTRPALYAGGQFSTAGGVTANRIAKWDGASWSPLGSGMNDRVWDLTVFDDGSGAGPALYAGGEFATSPAGDSFLAKWQGCTVQPKPGDLNGDGLVNGIDLLILLNAWETAGLGGEDINGDGIVDGADLLILLNNWT